MITQLLYTSRSLHERGHPTDFEILQEAIANNRGESVTGYLLRDRFQFCQVLEGQSPVVDDLFDRIAADPRHDEVVLRMRRTVPERLFLGWSMGYASLSPEDSAFLARSFADEGSGMLRALERIGQVAVRNS